MSLLCGWSAWDFRMSKQKEGFRVLLQIASIVNSLTFKTSFADDEGEGVLMNRITSKRKYEKRN